MMCKYFIGLSPLSNLILKESAHLRAKELYLIALAIDVDPCEVLNEIHCDVKLEN